MNNLPQFYDSHGVPIHDGDLLRTYHFTGARRKRYWLYHVAVACGDHYDIIPTSELSPRLVGRGGRVRMKQQYASEATVISGHGPDSYISYEDRPRRKPDAVEGDS